MKRTILAGMIGACFMMLSGAVSAIDSGGFVMVNMDRLFNEYHKTQLADAQLKEQADQFNDERMALIAEYEAMNDNFQQLRDEAQDPALSEAVRAQKRDAGEDLLLAIREQEQRVRRMEQQRRKQLEDQQRRMRSRIVDEINDVIERFAKTRNYQAVIDSSGQSLNAVPVVVYSIARLDVTDEVLEILNKGAE